MKGYAHFEFSNGQKFTCNIRARGNANLLLKCDAVANRLEQPGKRELVRWTAHYNETLPGREFVRVNSRWHVSGTVYNCTYVTHIIKRLR